MMWNDSKQIIQEIPRVLQEIIDLWMKKSDPTWEFLKRVLGKMSMNNIASTI